MDPNFYWSSKGVMGSLPPHIPNSQEGSGQAPPAQEGGDDHRGDAWTVDGVSAVGNGAGIGFKNWWDPSQKLGVMFPKERSDGEERKVTANKDRPSDAVLRYMADPQRQQPLMSEDHDEKMGEKDEDATQEETPKAQKPTYGSKLPEFSSTYQPMMMGTVLDWMDDDGDQWPENKQTTSTSNMPHPTLTLPQPSLAYDFRMSVTLNPKISVGQTPSGNRNWISFSGGSFAGSWGSGIVLPGGQDSQIVTLNFSARVETTYLLQTHDSPPAYIVVKTSGWRTGPDDVLAKLNDPKTADSVDPASYSFRLYINLETGDSRYADKINYGMWIGSGMRKANEVIYDAYRIS